MKLEDGAPHMHDIFERDDFDDKPVARAAPGMWPPPLNAFGMIGQQSLVAAFEERIAYARHRNTRLADSILSGLPGAGKSSIARAIARLTADGHCLSLNGADIESPKAFVKAIGVPGAIQGDGEVRFWFNRARAEASRKLWNRSGETAVAAELARALSDEDRACLVHLLTEIHAREVSGW